MKVGWLNVPARQRAKVGDGIARAWLLCHGKCGEQAALAAIESKIVLMSCCSTRIGAEYATSGSRSKL